MKTEEQSKKLELVKKHITSYPDFPKPDIVFRDMFSILREPAAFTALYDVLIDHVRSVQPQIQCIVGLEARGFIFGPLIAIALKMPFVPIRKKGKLPGNVKGVKYQLEYGQDEFEVQTDAMSPNTNVLIIDDLLATGGTLAAACELLSSCKVTIVQCLVIMELTDLDGKRKVPCDVHSFVQF